MSNLYLACCYTVWGGIKPNGSKQVAYMPVYESREEALEEWPEARVLEITGPEEEEVPNGLVSDSNVKDKEL